MNATEEEVGKKKVSIPTDEMKLAKKQPKEDGFDENLTGWVRWLIRKNIKKHQGKSQ